MAAHKTNIPLAKAALIAGIALLVITLVTPFAEFYAFPKLIIRGNAAATTQSMLANRPLLGVGIVCYLINFICDIVLAWALYLLLKPVNSSLSLLAAIFRLIYTAIGLAAMLNLVTIFRLLNTPTYMALLKPDQLQAQVMFCVLAFKSGWSFSIITFGIHLLLLGYLAFRSGYIPPIFGILLIIAGLGWVIDGLQPFLFPGFINPAITNGTGAFELIFMLWLLIRGWKIAEFNV